MYATETTDLMNIKYIVTIILCARKKYNGRCIARVQERRQWRNNGPPSICIALVVNDDAFHRFRVCSGALWLHVTGLDIDAHWHIIILYKIRLYTMIVIITRCRRRRRRRRSSPP